MGKKSDLDLIAKFGLDNRALTSLLDYLQYIKTNDLFKAVMKYLLSGRSVLEIKYKKFGKALIEKETAQAIIFSGYEWFSFRLPGGTYTPDWCYLLDTGQWVCVEVKQSKFARGYRDARAKLRAAATLNPWFRFYEIRPDGKDWIIEEIKPDEKFLHTFEQLTGAIDEP